MWTAPRSNGPGFPHHSPFMPVFFFNFHHMDIIITFVCGLNSSLEIHKLQINRQLAGLIDFHFMLLFPEVQAPRGWRILVFIGYSQLLGMADTTDPPGLLSLGLHTQAQNPQHGVPESQSPLASVGLCMSPLLTMSSFLFSTITGLGCEL